MVCPKGTGGRPKKTLREKEILGVKHKSRLNQNAPTVIPDRIEKFKNLGKVGQSIFNFYEPMLYNNGTLSASDAIPLYMLCKKYEDWYGFVEQIEKEGKYIVQGRVKTIAPWTKLEREAFNDLLKICREFGLTPVSRASVNKIARNEKQSEFDKLT